MIRSRIALRVLESVVQKRCFSVPAIRSARLLLGLDPHVEVTDRVLRQAYLQAALKCHPDVKKDKSGDEFTEITRAYELLQAGVVTDDDLSITPDEDETFRRACMDWLGLPAEIVEDSKRCPIFRNWLTGGTEASIRWQQFLTLHGGLAPMLRPVSAFLEDQRVPTKVMERRKKR